MKFFNFEICNTGRRPDAVTLTPEELAIAMHAIENSGRIARFGAAYCGHQEKADKILAYVRSRQA